jgi:hypothetical protein
MTNKHDSNYLVILLTTLIASVLLSCAPRMHAQQLATLSVTVTDPGIAQEWPF